MTTTLTRLLARLRGRATKLAEPSPAAAAAAVEPLERRMLMSGDSIWVDLGYPAAAFTQPAPTTALLLPAVQAAREAARAIPDGTSNTILVAESYGQPAATNVRYANPASYQIISPGK